VPVKWLAKILGCAAALLLLAGLLSAAAAQSSERRIALVIGVGKYKSAPILPNPPRDAHAVAQALVKLGFDVDEKLDVDERQFASSLREFGIKAQTADVALFYFAGHGMQVDRENYLVPADAMLQREHDLVYEAMRLDLVLSEVSQARNLGIVILDACRNNPFLKTTQVARSTRGADLTPGLARVDDVPKGTIVAMATRANAVAEDGEGDHSPFTAALLANFQSPGIELGLFFRKVRDAVLATTRGQQEPYTFGSLGAQAFYFKPEAPNQPPAIPALIPVELQDNTGAKALGISGIKDPDGDPVTVHVTGLPKGGTLRVGDRVLLIGDTLTLDQLAHVTFTPDGSFTGQAGPFSFTADDGRGGVVPASLFIKIVPSRRPPEVERDRMVLAVSNSLGIRQALGIREPTDPEGDPMTVTVTELPTQGAIVNDTGHKLRLGDKMSPEDLTRLNYDPGASPGGDGGAFAYAVDDGHGGKASGHVRFTVVGATAPSAAEMPPPAAPPSAAPPSAAPVASKPAAPPKPAAEKKTAEEKAPAIAMATSPPPAPPAGKEEGRRPGVQPALSGAPPGRVTQSAEHDCDHCPAMAELPPGSFTMGDNTGDPSSRPVHRVTLGRGFAISKTVITAGQWRACVAAGGCKPVVELAGAPDDSPARNVSWEDAQDYVAWLSKTAGRPYRLPSEAEWEYAARAGTESIYWWGNEPGRGHANCQDCGGPFNKDAPEPVSAFPANPFGLFGMGGGVAQWMADCWYPNYAGAPRDGSVRDKSECRERVIRGGSWRNDHTYATSASRFYYEPDVRYIANGFRVVRDQR
jgi:formylglycine-generating enzyme required for sulfatase activity